MIVKKRVYLNRLKYYQENEKNIVVIQSFVKMWTERQKYLAKLKYFRDNVRICISVMGKVEKIFICIFF
jgi:hypothetical protein